MLCWLIPQIFDILVHCPVQFSDAATFDWHRAEWVEKKYLWKHLFKNFICWGHGESVCNWWFKKNNCVCDLFLCCPVICANLGGTTSVPLVPASQPLATSKAHSALRPHHTKPLWWCSVMPVLIQHPQDTHLYAPFWQQCITLCRCTRTPN